MDESGWRCISHMFEYFAITFLFRAAVMFSLHFQSYEALILMIIFVSNLCSTALAPDNCIIVCRSSCSLQILPANFLLLSAVSALSSSFFYSSQWEHLCNLVFVILSVLMEMKVERMTNQGSLGGIDALLGCPLHLPSPKASDFFLVSILYC